MLQYIQHPSPLGLLTLAASEHGLCAVYFAQHAHWSGQHNWQHAPDHALLQQTGEQLDQYFAGQRQQFDIALDMRGSAFQIQVWQGLLDIQFGTTANYAELAQRIGRPKAARALGAANGRNPISIIVPCHRVIGKDGALTGYAGGLERKQFLLKLEQTQLTK